MQGKGINEYLVPDAVEAISTYKQRLTDELNNMARDIKFDTAFIGENQSREIDFFYDRVLSSVNATFVFLDSFGTTLDEVRQSYIQQEQNVADEMASANTGSNNG